MAGCIITTSGRRHSASRTQVAAFHGQHGPRLFLNRQQRDLRYDPAPTGRGEMLDAIREWAARLLKKIDRALGFVDRKPMCASSDAALLSRSRCYRGRVAVGSASSCGGHRRSRHFPGLGRHPPHAALRPCRNRRKSPGTRAFELLCQKQWLGISVAWPGAVKDKLAFTQQAN